MPALIGLQFKQLIFSLDYFHSMGYLMFEIIIVKKKKACHILLRRRTIGGKIT